MLKTVEKFFSNFYFLYMKEKILVIPDIHARRFWKKAVEKYLDKVDRIIFLGDYLDPYPWEGYTRKESISNFQEIIDFKLANKDKVILLLGNHCIQYINKCFLKRSRYDSSNAYHISEMFNSHKSLFQLAYEETVDDKKYLFTHAGFLKPWYDDNKRFIGEPTIDNLNRLLGFREGIIALADVSSFRGGFSKCGSIVWADVYEHYYDNVMMPQWDYEIFGHSQQENDPIITDKWACLDCRRAFILYEDGKIEACTEEDKKEEVEN